MLSSTCTCGYTISDEDDYTVDEKMRLHTDVHKETDIFLENHDTQIDL
ncbi:MAG: hypothetical protein RL557_604 [archaeon]